MTSPTQNEQVYPRFIYVLDPMCSWCWAFSDTVHELQRSYPFPWTLLMGGLAPDSNEPMPIEMQQKLQSIWQHIEQQTGTPFNYDFWSNNTPKRSTYASCRAVISAEELSPGSGLEMTRLIQNAYYLNAKNPSELDTLIELAQQQGLDISAFKTLMSSPETQRQLEKQINASHGLGAQGFPSLFIETKEGIIKALSYGYTDAIKIKSRIDSVLTEAE